MIGIITGLVLIGSACLARRAGASRSAIDWHAVYFATLAMTLWLITVVYQFAQSNQPPLLVIRPSPLLLRSPCCASRSCIIWPRDLFWQPWSFGWRKSEVSSGLGGIHLL